MGLVEILIAIISVLCGGLYFRGNYHKKKADDNFTRSEHYRKESTMKTAEVESLQNQNKIKGEAHANEKKIESSNSGVSGRVDIGVSDTTRNSNDKS